MYVLKLQTFIASGKNRFKCSKIAGSSSSCTNRKCVPSGMISISIIKINREKEREAKYRKCVQLVDVGFMQRQKYELWCTIYCLLN